MIARLGIDHFRVITGSSTVDSDLGWIRLQQRSEDSELTIFDVTDEYAVIGLWGPCARDILQQVTADDVSSGSFPYMTARTIEIGGFPVTAQRVSYAGELGWEIYVPTSEAVFVWDRVWAAGEEFQMMACGYKAIESLRLEKGYLAFGSDITPHENPYEARTEFCLKPKKKADFVGRQALAEIQMRGIERRLCTMIIGSEDYLTLYGGEAVVRNGSVVGRLRSAGYGHFVGKNIGYAYLPLELAEEGTRLEVEMFGELVPAVTTADVLYDPPGKALKQWRF
jgi:4-methylaminobutanoate oxidase (formaldehyde-forming)